MSTYRIECEECENTTIVETVTQESPQFCSICGRRALIEKTDDSESIFDELDFD